MISLGLVLLAAAAPGPTVAVHYFDNRTNDPKWDVLCKGVADMLITDLSQAPGLTVVEREKLEAVVNELKLQRSQWFDPKSAQQVGKLLGATVIVTGQFIELEPTLAIEARAIDVKSGKVVTASRVTGTAQDFFSLELQLAGALAAGLVKGAKAGANGPADTATLLEYAKALDDKDRGDLESAQVRLAQVVRASPDFRLGKQRAAELVAFVSKVSAENEAALSATRRDLEERLMKRAAAKRGTDTVCSAVLLSALAASDLRAVVGEGISSTGSNVLKRSRHAAAKTPLERLAKLGADVLDAVTKEPVGRGRTGCRGTERDETDFAALQSKIPAPAVLTRTAVLDGLIRLLAFGQVPPWAGETFRVAPALVVLDAAWRDQTDAYLVAFKEALLDKDSPLAEATAMGDWTELAGQVDVLFGRPDAAIEKWQAFLTKYPGAKGFPQVKKRLELLLGTTPEAQNFAIDLSSCGPELKRGLSREVQRVGWAEGAKGLQRLQAKVEAACKGKKDALAQLYVALVSEAAFWSECALLGAAERKLAALEPNERHAVFADICVE